MPCPQKTAFWTNEKRNCKWKSLKVLRSTYIFKKDNFFLLCGAHANTHTKDKENRISPLSISFCSLPWINIGQKRYGTKVFLVRERKNFLAVHFCPAWYAYACVCVRAKWCFVRARQSYLSREHFYQSFLFSLFILLFLVVVAVVFVVFGARECKMSWLLWWLLLLYRI